MYFVLAMASVWLATMWVARASFRMGMPALVPALCPAMLLYLGSLVPGVAGLLSATNAAVAVVTISLAMAVVAWRFTPRSVRQSKIDGGETTVVDWVLAGFCLVPAVWVASFVLTTSRGVLTPEEPLFWDTVSYHLPGFVEFVQNRTLWSMEGPYQSYHFGYEIVANFPTYFSKGPWGVHFGHLAGLLIAFLVIAELSRRVLEQTSRGSSPGRWLAVSLGSVTLWGVLFEENLRGVGKNDVFTTLCTLGSLVVALEAAAGSERSRTAWFAGVSGALLGLAGASKPPAFVFVFALAPFFAMVAPVGSRLRALVTCGLGVGLVGGFWPLRNVILLGGLSDPQLAVLWQRTVIAHWRDPALYVLDRAAVLWGFAAAAVIVLVVSGSFRRGAFGRPRWGLLLSFLVLGLLTFVVTPAGVDVVGGRAYWHLRLGMAVFTLAVIVVTAFLVDRAGSVWRGGASGKAAWIGGLVGAIPGVFVARSASWATEGSPLTALGGLAFVVALGGLLWLWVRPHHHRAVLVAGVLMSFVGLCVFVGAYARIATRPMDGLPGYEQIGGRPPTGIYRWIQSLEDPVWIYAVGLRPWGLVGPELGNRLRYELNNAPFASPHGLNRLRLMLYHFEPDLVIVSVDPHNPSVEEPIPHLSWLETEPCLTEVYRDETVAAFRVGGGCTSLTAEPWLADSKPPRSSG